MSAIFGATFYITGIHLFGSVNNPRDGRAAHNYLIEAMQITAAHIALCYTKQTDTIH